MIKYRVEAVLFLMVFLSLASGCNYGSQRESHDGSKKQEPSSASGSTAQTSGAPTAGDASLAGLQEEVVKLRAELRTVQERVAMLDGLATGPKNVPGGRAIDTGAAATPESRASLATSTGSSPDSPILPAEYSPTSAYKDDPFVGPEDAPVIVMVFSDFQCPGCRRFDTDVIGRLRSDYAARGSVKLIFRDFPLERNQFARSAATLAHCAG